MEERLVKLKNGVKVVLVRTEEFRSIYARLSVRGGPSIESKEKTGVSHFVEHMVSQSTKRFPDRDKLDEKIEMLGGNHNGYTSENMVWFKITVPDHELGFALDYLEEISFNALFPDRELKTERGAILDEIHNSDTDPYRKFINFWKKARYTKDSMPPEIAGTKSIISKIPKKTLLDWYPYLMSPNNMTLTLVGHFDLDEAEKEIKNRFEARKNHNNPITVETYQPHAYLPKNIATQVDKEQKQAIGIISFPGLSLEHDSYKERQAARILEKVVANSQMSLLFKKLRKQLGLIYSIYVDQSFGPTYPGLFDIVFTTSDENMERVYTEVLNELHELDKNGIREEMLELAIEGVNNSLKMGYSSIGEIVEWYTAGVFWTGEIRSIEEAIEIRRSIDLDFANDIMKRIIDWDRVCIVSRVSSAGVKKRIEGVVQGLVL